MEVYVGRNMYVKSVKGNVAYPEIKKADNRKYLQEYMNLIKNYKHYSDSIIKTYFYFLHALLLFMEENNLNMYEIQLYHIYKYRETNY